MSHRVNRASRVDLASRLCHAAAIFIITPSVVAIAAGACSNVLGIEEREYAPPGTPCDEYCAEAMSICVGNDQLYASMDTCLGTCSHLEEGALGATRGNSISCRRSQLQLAEQTGELADYCKRAGPGGEGTCGSNCRGYCAVMVPVCGTEWFDTTDACLAACAAIPDNHDYSIKVPYENSVQCRLYHVTAATIDTAHCPHAGGRTKCVAANGGRAPDARGTPPDDGGTPDDGG